MDPILAASDQTDCSSGHAVSAPQSPVGFRARAYGAHVTFTKARHPMPLTAQDRARLGATSISGARRRICPASACHVTHVLRMRSGAQVRRVHARAICGHAMAVAHIARVHDACTVRYRPVRKLPRKAMCLASPVTEVAIAARVQRSGPHPATIQATRAIDMGPKSTSHAARFESCWDRILAAKSTNAYLDHR